ncbi:MAG: formyltransferase family protein [Gammaproteobacteria bacterium]|nr:formyltransferase family protein [Gammaproteobacteria bacterium]
MRFFYIGSAGPLSRQPLEYLLSAGFEVCGVGLDPLPPDHTLSSPTLVLHDVDSLDVLARTKDLPVVALTQPLAEVLNAISRLQPDAILVSCYARKLPDELLDVVPLGAFNLHPSRLPAFRGPTPLFWQFRSGTPLFGLSLHRMTSQIDAGPVLASQSVSMPDGITMTAAIDRLSGLIAPLLEDGCAAIRAGELGAEQHSIDASYQGYPEIADFAVSVEWTAQRLFNFMRATEHMGQVYPCRIEGRQVLLRHALSYSSDQEIPTQAVENQTIRVSCTNGTLLASYYQ